MRKLRRRRRGRRAGRRRRPAGVGGCRAWEPSASAAREEGDEVGAEEEDGEAQEHELDLDLGLGGGGASGRRPAGRMAPGEEEEAIATKVLEGTHHVVHPNGSSMFIALVGEPSTEAFPWQTDEESRPVDIERSFAGEGIATGYGFRYPGSKPGSLFVLQDGRLAFVWRDNKAVLTLQRLNLEELLRKGERVPALPPIPNFAYLTKSYSNVFAAFHGSSSCSSSPR